MTSTQPLWTDPARRGETGCPSKVTVEVAVFGGGLGAVAASLASLRSGKTVCLVSPHRWLGGQLTTQGVPLDEHPWIEYGLGPATYREFRVRIREYYRRNYPLKPQERSAEALNPGKGNIGSLTHEPRVAAAVLEEMMAPYMSGGRLRVLYEARPLEAGVTGGMVNWVTVLEAGEQESELAAEFYIDATECGDLLPLVGAEVAVGAESAEETGELHAVDQADPLEQQAATWCFAVDYVPGGDFTIARPTSYEKWREIRLPDWPDYQFSWQVSDHVTHLPRERRLFVEEPGPQWAWDLWHARRVFSRHLFSEGFAASDVTLANWPQMDYWDKPFLGVNEEYQRRARTECRELSESFLYWMQTEAPRLDGGHGYPELRLRPETMGTRDGFAMEPYYRESRRIVSEFRLQEQHIGVEARGHCGYAESFEDTVGIGAYRIDIHPSTRMRNTVDIDTYPYEIPLGALVPIRFDNLLAGSKNIGSTRVAHAAYRVHPTEWAVGEAAGHTASYAIRCDVTPREIRNGTAHLAQLQQCIANDGTHIRWPRFGALTPESRSGWKDENR